MAWAITFFHPRLNFEIFQNMYADTSDLADTTRTIPDSADAFTNPIRIEGIDTHGPSVTTAKFVSLFVNGA